MFVAFSYSIANFVCERRQDRQIERQTSRSIYRSALLLRFVAFKIRIHRFRVTIIYFPIHVSFTRTFRAIALPTSVAYVVQYSRNIRPEESYCRKVTVSQIYIEIGVHRLCDKYFVFFLSKLLTCHDAELFGILEKRYAKYIFLSCIAMF